VLVYGKFIENFLTFALGRCFCQEEKQNNINNLVETLQYSIVKNSFVTFNIQKNILENLAFLILLCHL